MPGPGGGGRRQRRPGVVVHVVVVVLALVQGEVVLPQGEGDHSAPFGAEEGDRVAGLGPARLVDKFLQAEGLPEIGVDDIGITRLVRSHGWIDGGVEQIVVAKLFVGAVLKAEFDELLGDIIAQRRRLAAPVVGAGEIGIVAQRVHEPVDARQGGPQARRVGEAVLHEAVGGVAHGPMAGGLDVVGTGDPCKRAGEAAHGPAQQIGPFGAVAVRDAGVVQGDADVEEIAGVDRGAGEIGADRRQQGFVPLPRHRVLGGGGSGLRREGHHEPEQQSVKGHRYSLHQFLQTCHCLCRRPETGYSLRHLQLERRRANSCRKQWLSATS